MRKILSLVIIVPLIILGILIFRNQNTNPQKSSAFEPTATSNTSGDLVIINNLAYSWFKVGNVDSLKLIPNFDQKSSSEEVASTNKCRSLSSGGFYSKENKPIGLFVADGNTIGNWQNNSLLDGVLSINDMATPRITRNVPRDHLRIALQSGPIIKENGLYLSLSIQNDSPSRRVVAGVSGENKLYFVVIYNPQSEYVGPNLGDMPKVLKDFEDRTGILFADIINLDGGSASSFYDQNIKLTELNNVGAFFCLP